MNTPLKEAEAAHVLETILLLERQQRMLDDALRVLRPMVGMVPDQAAKPDALTKIIYTWRRDGSQSAPTVSTEPGIAEPKEPGLQTAGKKPGPSKPARRSDWIDKVAGWCRAVGAHGSQFGNAEIMEIARGCPELDGLSAKDASTRVAQAMHSLKKRGIVELAAKEGRHPMWRCLATVPGGSERSSSGSDGYSMLDQIHREIDAKKKGVA